MPCTTPGTPWPMAAPPGRFDADQLGVGVDEAGEDPGRVRPAADARHDDVGVATEHARGTARWPRRR